MSRHILELPVPPSDVRIPYGTDRFQFGDLRLPRGNGPHPVAVVIHGGFWRSRYDLSAIGHLAAALREAGLATWNIEYRRIGNPGGGWPGTFFDVSEATEHLSALARSYPLDLGRVVTVGHSAGGHLALWVAAQHSKGGEEPSDASRLPVIGAVSLAGVTDLQEAWRLRLSDGVVAELLGGPPDRVPDRYAAASPAQLLPLGVLQVLIHGLQDDTVPPALSEGYVSRAVRLGDEAHLITFPDAGHFEVIDPRAPEWRIVRDAVLRLASPV